MTRASALARIDPGLFARGARRRRLGLRRMGSPGPKRAGRRTAPARPAGRLLGARGPFVGAPAAAERLRVALDELSVAVGLNLELLRSTHKALASGRLMIGFPANLST